MGLRELGALVAGIGIFVGPAHAADAPAASSSSAPSVPVDVPAPPGDAKLPAVEPVISDEEFNRSIPPLAPADDAAANAPLESAAEFEARLADPKKTGQVLPSMDPELAKPLPPLGEFDVSQVEFAAPASTATSAETHYAVVVEGLDKVDGETDASMRGLFNSLSALREAKGRAANEAMLAARLTEDSRLLERILHSEGWYEARVTTRIDHADGKTAAGAGAPVQAVLTVAPGARYSLGTIAIHADPTVPPGLIANSLALKVGEPIVAERIQGAEANIAVVLPQNGYAFAEVGQRDIELDPETHLGDYVLPVTVGPRGRFGDITTKGVLAFDARHVGVLARFKRGDLYDSRKVDDLRKALVATGLLATVAVEPQRTNAPTGDGTEPVTLVVTQTAGPARTIAASAGYATGQGFSATGTWTHANLFPPEGALIVSGVAGTATQSAGVTFRRSNVGQRDRTFQVTLSAIHSKYDAFEAFTGELSARISYDSTPLWQKPVTYAFGAELLGSVEKAWDFTVGAKANHQYLVGGISAQVGLDRSDSLLDPTRGWRLALRVQPEASLRGKLTPYVRTQLDASGYVPLGRGLVLAGRARVASIGDVSLETLAPSRRLYAGGGGSVRGFGYQDLGPKDPVGDPLGGLSLVEGSAEARYRFGNYGIVGFVDVGQAYDSRYPTFRNLRAGVGIGGRFYTNFGPFRLDVATPIDRQPGEAKINVYVSIGQAF